ncbi:hypothetical protein [Larkinella soli]|uniref:hypothetical protein n=1 Tax=Larkinella soli TaxID=1770527 RepID=UPI000FFC1CAC|nr:hypothetical protein [Larkinella soli]
MTQDQHAAVVSFLTLKCHLIETAFIEEMTDHLLVSVEARMADSLSFDEALAQTVQDFGGPIALQKLEWTYRLGFLKSGLRDWWGLVKSRFSGPKRLRTLVVVGFITLAGLFSGLITDFIGGIQRSVVWTSFQLGGVIAVGMLTWFLLQGIFPIVRKVGVVRFPRLFRTWLSFLPWSGALLGYLGLSSLEIPHILQGPGYSVLWSTFAVFYLACLDYAQQTDPDSWYQTR